MPDLEQLRQNLQDVSERLRAKTRAYDQATGSRDEIQAELKRLRARKERAQEEAEAEAFLPGREHSEGAVAARTRSEVEELDGRIEEAETRIERLKAEKNALREEQKEAAQALARALVRPVVDAEERRREVLARIGSAVLPAYLEYLEAVQDRDEALLEFRRAVGTAAATSTQRRALDRHLQQQVGGEVPPEVLLGLLLADVLSWARRVNRGPLPELLEREGIRLLGGSPRHQPPVGAVEEVLAWIEDGRVPDGPSVT